MGKNTKWLLIVLGIFVVLFGINQLQQSNLGSSSDQVFEIEREDVFNFDISSGVETISLSFNGESWAIDGNDTLVVKENTINNFFDKVLKVKRTSLVSRNQAKWDKFNVGDSTGTLLVLKDHNSESLGRITVGRSGAEWSASNIRVGDEVEVYQTNENIAWQLNTSPTYWGEVPPPPEPDSTAIDSL
ncbi:MAG: hypothetical protein QF842_05225 [Candidatus Marinimicrobia bacterium]|jgi:hypothetical protein|nr:hypothetical protein [Candidatus Neomarinimicrobiota bacterium]MDP6611189.1 hypothetical protein [Candidatus Neomarinimicrobiota bacterium]|tara:strand:- start:127 stop:687 length:561 start_codon:yes stop_codon:yes gene_type:complete